MSVPMFYILDMAVSQCLRHCCARARASCYNWSAASTQL